MTVKLLWTSSQSNQFYPKATGHVIEEDEMINLKWSTI